MNRIWAPWRKRYVSGEKKTRGCLFCRVVRAPARKDKTHLLLHRTPHSFLMLNRYPYNNGHLMIVPHRHVPSLARLKDNERLDLLKLLDRSLEILAKAIHPQGFNVGMNLGRAAGAGFPGHVHIHIVPRWVGDTNFMPILGETKVISDSLQAVYQALSRLLKR